MRRAGATKGRDFVSGWGLWWELRHRNRDGQRVDRAGIGLVMVLGPGVGAGEKEVGVGAQCAGAEQAGHDCFLGFWVEALVGTAGGRARRNRDGQRIEDGLGAGVEAPRRRSEVEAGAEAGAAEGRDFFLGGGFVVGANCGAAIGMGSESGMGMGLVLVLA